MMRLHELIDGEAAWVERGSSELVLGDLVEDSRRATPGCAFFARRGGELDGRRFIADAAARGAVTVITDISPSPKLVSELPADFAWIRVDRADTDLAATLAHRFFRRPSEDMAVLGVTGTNGKTTVATLIQHFLSVAGVACGLIGTLGARLPTGEEISETGLTTPGPIEFARLLALMRDRGCRAVVAEVSSHALEQGRLGSMRLDVGVFTNLTGDHLDYHGSMESYAAAKAKLFGHLAESGWAVVNADDAYAKRMLASFTGSAERVMRCTLGAEAAESSGKSSPGNSPGNMCRAKVLSLTADASRASLEGPWGAVEATLPLVGRHNVANALEAVAAAQAVVDLTRVLETGLERCPPVPGRLERVTGSAAAIEVPSVLVDYAHTHDALENVLSTLRPLTQGRLCLVFGCGGDRDRSKRSKMARVAARFADEIWITSDNPRSEDPRSIIDQIVAGLPGSERCSPLKGEASASAGVTQPKRRPEAVHIEPDRGKAIAGAISGAESGDTVLIAGKGHENYQVLADRTIHFDDREQAAAALRQWEKERSVSWPPKA